MFDLLKTKTFWAGVAAIASGVGLILSGDLPQGAVLIMGGINGIFMRHGIQKVGNTDLAQRTKAAQQKRKNEQKINALQETNKTLDTAMEK